MERVPGNRSLVKLSEMLLSAELLLFYPFNVRNVSLFLLGVVLTPTFWF